MVCHFKLAAIASTGLLDHAIGVRLFRRRNFDDSMSEASTTDGSPTGSPASLPSCKGFGFLAPRKDPEKCLFDQELQELKNQWKEIGGIPHNSRAAEWFEYAENLGNKADSDKREEALRELRVAILPAVAKYWLKHKPQYPSNRPFDRNDRYVTGEKTGGISNNNEGAWLALLQCKEHNIPISAKLRYNAAKHLLQDVYDLRLANDLITEMSEDLNRVSKRKDVSKELEAILSTGTKIVENAKTNWDVTMPHSNEDYDRKKNMWKSMACEMREFYNKPVWKEAIEVQDSA